jgi:hypothetical protein
MANTFKKIQTVTVGSGGAASIDFTSIPQTYTDLKIVVSARSTYSALTDTLFVKPNGLTTNGSSRWIIGDGLNAGASSSAAFNYVREINGNTATASTFASVEIYAPNYTSSNYKSFSSEGVTENNAGVGVRTGITAGLWSSTAAITSITLTATNGDFVQYSTATLYGVSNVPVAEGAKATGGIITADSSYFYHTFLSSDTFTPTQNLTVDYLVVAGGGGGGKDQGGGGGAGGLRCTVGATGGGGSLESALSLTASTGYTVTVGAGGASETSGNNSVFSSITSTAGGRGASTLNNGTSGGSGGGAGGQGGARTGGAGTANQGYAGGNSVNQSGGGGGGAGSVGANGTGSSNNSGGSGVSTSISGTATTYAAGGIGDRTITPENGGANTGTGGAGNNANATAGAGGSGIVIVRYAR